LNFDKVKLPALPRGASSHLLRNPPKQIRLSILRSSLLRRTGAKAMADTLFAFIPALPDGAFCEGG
jgi:hypothetical protein